MAYEFRCRDAGASCRWSVEERAEPDLLKKIARHYKDRHGVAKVSRTLGVYLRKHVRER